jgi:hypothetical protein
MRASPLKHLLVAVGVAEGGVDAEIGEKQLLLAGGHCGFIGLNH